MKILKIDSSARASGSDEVAFGSHTRRLTERFARSWKDVRPQDQLIRREVGMNPPKPVTARWIHAAFTKPEAREPWMREVLEESDLLVDELLAADVIVAGVPMYNFGPPAQFKAYIDNVVRVGRTFGFDRSRKGDPYWPLIEGGKRLIIVSSRGDYGYGDGGRIESLNHVEPAIRTAFRYIGITDVRSVAIEYDEFADERVRASVLAAERDVDALVHTLVSDIERKKAA